MFITTLERQRFMIYTVTFNPSLDYVVRLDHFNTGELNRTQSEELQCGGKGINVSIVLSRLGMNNTALGFVGGFTGEALRAKLHDMGIKEAFTALAQGQTRINVKVKSDKETEINAKGPAISSDDMARFMDGLSCLNKGDVLVLAGSVPRGVEQTIYKEILQAIKAKEVCTVLDAEGALFMNALECRPFLVKPNHIELGAIFGQTIATHADVVRCALQLQQRGAQNVLVSMAGEGAVLIDEKGAVYTACAPKGAVKNSVGAGDSMVAGFLSGWLESGDYIYALRMGIAAGSACAFSTALPEKKEIAALFAETKVAKES